MQAPAQCRNGWTQETLALVLTCLVVSGGALQAQELAPVKSSLERATLDNPAADWGPEYTNWVEVSVGNFFVDGNRAAFQERHQLPATAFGGVESFHVEQRVGTNGLFQIDGRGIFDNHDYDLRLDYTQDKLGYVRGGFREFRTWYDRHGGFSPLGNVWLTPFGEEVGLDRGEVWFEGGLRLENVPEITIRYSHQFRDGLKDSLEWGDANVNPGGTAVIRAITPAFYDIDEIRDSVALDLKHRISTTDFGIGVRYEWIDQDNEKKFLRRPGEAAQERAVTQKNFQDTDLFNAHAFTQTPISEKVLLTSGYAFTTMDIDLSGSRIYGAGFDAVYDPLFARRQFHDEGFLDLSGGGSLNQYLFNLNLLTTPWDNVSILPGIRVEEQDYSMGSRFTSVDVGAPPTLTPISEDMVDHGSLDFWDISESLEVRYTGFTNWLLYARGEWTENTGNLKENEIISGTNSPFQNTDSDRFWQKYTAGLNWYPLQRMNLASQYYHKIHSANWKDPLADNVAYPGLLQDQDFETDDVNFRVTLRPLATLTLVTRYDFQLSTIDTRAGIYGEIQTAEVTSHIIGESVSWSPLPRLYLQGNFSYVLDETDTPANDLVSTNGTPLNLVLTSQNNYWNASALVGFALNDKTDLQAQYFYYRANDYVNNSAASQPYGAGAEENGVTATLTRQLSKALRWTLKYGFFTNHDPLYGGHRDYNAHLVYSSLQYRF